MARTKARCLGYVGEQQRWEEKAVGPWFNTGDIGIRTRTGSVVFLDREVDEIPGMSCVELEDVINDRLGEVLECVVLGTPGRPPLPVVVTRDGRLDDAAWQAPSAICRRWPSRWFSPGMRFPGPGRARSGAWRCGKSWRVPAPLTAPDAGLDQKEGRRPP